MHNVFLQDNVHLDFSGWGAAFTADVQYQERSQKMSKEEHLYVKTESVCGVYEVVMDQYKPPKLREGTCELIIWGYGDKIKSHRKMIV